MGNDTPPPVPEAKEAQGGTGPSDELDRIARNDLREGICAVFGSRVREAVAMAIDAGYRRGRSDEAKAREVEVAALRGFVEKVRARYGGDPSFDRRYEDLESELAKVGGKGTK